MVASRVEASTDTPPVQSSLQMPTRPVVFSVSITKLLAEALSRADPHRPDQAGETAVNTETDEPPALYHPSEFDDPHVAVTVRLPTYLRDRLAAVAKAEGISLNAWMLIHLEEASEQP